jgi:hypothetical protein
LAACVLVFALLVQSTALTLAGAEFAAGATGQTDGTGFELCHHDGGNSTVPSGGPEAPADSGHCIFCLIGATDVPGVPVSAPKVQTIVIALVSWPFTAWRLPADTVDANTRPRGPPRAA